MFYEHSGVEKISRLHISTISSLESIKQIKKGEKDNLTITVGGSVDRNTLHIYKKNKEFLRKVHKMETRKVILSAKSFLNRNKAIESALKFEELYLLMKNEIINFKSKSDLSRLAVLRTRK